MVKFLRRTVNQYAKFGWGKGKKAKWRAPKGRDNKMRERIKGHPLTVTIGYRKNKKERGLIKERIPVIIKNVNDLQNLTNKQIGILGKVGKKNKIEIAKKALELKIELANLNAKAFLKKVNGSEKKE